jgi:hypothetical protein
VSVLQKWLKVSGQPLLNGLGDPKIESKPWPIMLLKTITPSLSPV